jgi:hypothetical protein
MHHCMSCGVSHGTFGCGYGGFKASSIASALAIHQQFSKILYYVLHTIMTAEVSWERAARAKQASISGQVPVEWRIKSADLPPVSALRDVSYFVWRYLSARELEITDTTAERILEKLGAGEWTALEVNRAFCHRAAIAHQLVCILSKPTRILKMC